MAKDEFKDFFKKHAIDFYMQSNAHAGQMFKAFVTRVCEDKNIIKVCKTAKPILNNMLADFSALDDNDSDGDACATDTKENESITNVDACTTTKEIEDFAKNLILRLCKPKSMNRK